MLAVAFLARALGRHPRPTRALALSLLIGVANDPLAAFDISFVLSAAATTGLVVLGRGLSAPARRLPTRPLRWLGAAVATTLSAMLPCVPLLAMLSPDITIAGVAANVVAAPVGELVALPLCLLHPLTAPLPALESGTALVASGALLWVKAVAHASAAARWLAVPVPDPGTWHLAVLAVAAFGTWATGKRWRWILLALGLLALAEARAARAGSPRDTLRISILDVGQGDALLVDLPDGKLMLVDGGGFVGSPVDPGKRVIVPLLRARRRERLDVMVISHPHPDHFTGLLSVLRAVEVGELWDTGQGERHGAGPTYAAILREARARGVPIRRPAELCGVHRHGRGELRVLAPCPGPVKGRGANDNSFVLRVSLGRRAALLVGDAERAEERDLLGRGKPLRADLLKVGHHGSRTSSSAAFLARARPQLAVISCGARNRFGHPHRATLRAFDDRDVHTLRTDLVGGVTWSTDGEHELVQSASEGP
jgi:competence protein ComEC